MAAVLHFGVPFICVTRYSHNGHEDGSIIPPIILVLDNIDHCLFIRDQVAFGSTNIVHFNIDESRNGDAMAAVFLESYRRDGFIFTPAEMEIFRQISRAKIAPFHDYKTPITRVVIGADFPMERDVANSVEDNLKRFGHLELTFGYIAGASGEIHSSDELPFFEFKDYTTFHNGDFVSSVF